MDFYKIQVSHKNDDKIVSPDWLVVRSRDLQVRGKAFHAIWDAEKGLWSTDEYDVQRLVDAELDQYATDLRSHTPGRVRVHYLGEFSSGSWTKYRSWLSKISDNAVALDETLTFQNTEVRKESYASKRLPYALEPGDISHYDELMSTLYEPEERRKLEWAIGSIVAGDAKRIQKFVVLYGASGTGKSTVMSIIQDLFQGYVAMFEAKALASNNNAFATEVFKENPLVAIQHDGDLSHIEDNSKLNSIISHEEIVINEKNKPTYSARINAFLFMGTNKPVKITDAKSGIIRRLIDVEPSGRLIPPDRYYELVDGVKDELGAIASHCLKVYKSLGRNYYNTYVSQAMMFKTNIFYNFMQDHLQTFRNEASVGRPGISLTRAYDMYKLWCETSNVEYKMQKHIFREELKNYFKGFSERMRVGDRQVRNWYYDLDDSKFEATVLTPDAEEDYTIVMDSEISPLDEILSERPAQLACEKGTPTTKWTNVKTTLSDVDTRKVHYVKPPEHHIVIDFDLKDETGAKSASMNLEAASQWPPTYAEFSKSGAGVHLHYIYEGDTSELKSLYSEGIEIKVFRGDASLRRRLTWCNGLPIAKLDRELPKKEAKMLDTNFIRSEAALREQVVRNIRKEIHGHTAPSIHFIKKILDDAYERGDIKYDLRDLRTDVYTLAYNSTNQRAQCIKLVQEMKFTNMEHMDDEPTIPDDHSLALTFFDVEVFPNLNIVCFKEEGSGTVNRIINPKPSDIEVLMKKKLVGFNNRRYDNHILWGIYLGYSTEQVYELSQNIVDKNGGVMKNGFISAYGLSYTDIFDFSATKQSLKKFEIELGLVHKELNLPWDEPVPEDRWVEVAEYCVNDVIATEAVFHALKEDWMARQALAKVSGLSVNHTNNQHAIKIITGGDKHSVEKLVYTDLSEMFPGYKFAFGKSTYKGEETGEGGYVYTEPGIHKDVALLDVASMHPTSLIELNYLGPYTERYKELKDARIAVKRGDFEKAGEYLDGALKPFLKDLDDPGALAYALKIVINSVYGLTSASFPNALKHPQNVDNIVAKRGALFMVDLKEYIQSLGYQVAHIKTDSVKIPNADQYIIDKVIEFGKKYGYDFEHEATYEELCLLNKAVYVAFDENGWHAVGAQFKHPYVFKDLFTDEKPTFLDMCETKSVTTKMFLTDAEDNDLVTPENSEFIGRVGLFCPIQKEYGGRRLVRELNGKYHNVNGTTGYYWMTASDVQYHKLEGLVDESYFRELCDAAIADIQAFGDLEYAVYKPL